MRFPGYFSRRFEPPAPFIRLLVSAPKLGLRGYVNFLVDTGASITLLLDKDVVRLGLDIQELRRAERDVAGIGGAVSTYEIDRVSLVFRAENGTLHKERLRLHVGRHDVGGLPEAARRTVWAMPSLLGRDVIYRFGLLLSRAQNQVYLERYSRVGVEV